jgi:1-acyl-sn-glycerol-3-phosphate acyltransferase
MLPPRDLAPFERGILPALRACVRAGYFSLAVEGAERLPRGERVIYVGNHAGWLTLDSLFFGLAIHEHRGPAALPYVAVNDPLLRLPGLGPFLARVGGIPASWLRDPARFGTCPSLGIFPEGTAGNCKPFYRAYRMARWRTGFVRLALQQRMRVVPIAGIGAEEAVPNLATVRALEPLLGTLLPVPACPVPLPSRWKLVVHEPVDLAASGVDPDDRAGLAALAAAVRATVQATLDHETRDRPLGRLARWVERLAG